MIMTWSRILSVKLKRVVDLRALFEVISPGLNYALDTAGEEKDYDDSCFSGAYNWNGGAMHKESIRRDHFDETHKFSLGRVEI